MLKVWNKFIELILDQFEYGGKKYKLNQQKESTDILFDTFGKNWLFGTMDKYIFRIRNLRRERDILKIATYSYILWLKRGFHISLEGINDPPINTTVEIKSTYFNNFTIRANSRINSYAEQYINARESSEEYLLESISSMFKYWSTWKWQEIKEWHILEVFCLSYCYWVKYFSNKPGQDTDTYNEEKCVKKQIMK